MTLHPNLTVKTRITRLLVLATLLLLCGCGKTPSEGLDTPGQGTGTFSGNQGSASGSQTNGSESGEPDLPEQPPYDESLVAAKIVVSINPLACVYLDSEGKVLYVEPLNEDAVLAYAEIHFDGLTFEDAVQEMTRAAIEHDYLADGGEVTIRVIEVRDEKLDVLQCTNTAQTAAEDTAQDSDIAIQTVSEDLCEEPICDVCSGSGICKNCRGKTTMDRECGLCNGSGVCKNCGGIRELACSECPGNGICPDCGGGGEASEICPDCNGTGSYDDVCPLCNGSHSMDCHRCEGTGKEVCSACNGKVYSTCWICHGEGGYTCKQCDGHGNAGGQDGGPVTTCPSCNGGWKTCSTCNGAKQVACGQCEGGYRVCNACGGNGKEGCNACTDGRFQGPCPGCDGSGERKDICFRCAGSGKCNACEGFGKIACPYCKGSGQCYDCAGAGRIEDTCPYCQGSAKCIDCDGRGLR